MNTLSWSTPTTPLPTEANPRVVFERLFGDGGTAAERKAELRKNGSILDWVTEDMARLERRLGPADRTRVDEYLDSRARGRAAHPEGRAAGRRRRCPTSSSGRRRARRPGKSTSKLMFDLQVLALQADITRVITFQLAREVSTRTYPQIGVAEAHHPTSHHSERSRRSSRSWRRSTRITCRCSATSSSELKATPDGDGTLLDHSLYLLGSGLGNPDVHDHTNLPILVAGGGSGQDQGRPAHQLRRADAAGEPAVTMLDKAGIEMERFADSTGKINELLASRWRCDDDRRSRT